MYLGWYHAGLEVSNDSFWNNDQVQYNDGEVVDGNRAQGCHSCIKVQRHRVLQRISIVYHG